MSDADLSADLERRRLRREIIDPHVADCRQQRNQEQQAIVARLREEMRAGDEQAMNTVRREIAPMRADLWGRDGDMEHTGIKGLLGTVITRLAALERAVNARPSLPAHMTGQPPRAPESAWGRLWESITRNPAPWALLVASLAAAALVLVAVIRGGDGQAEAARAAKQVMEILRQYREATGP